MNMLKLLTALALLASLAGQAEGKNKVQIPKSARHLDSAGIVAAYAGKNVYWAPPEGNMSGNVVFNSDMTKSSGSFVIGKSHGTFEGMVSVENDLYCYTVKVSGKPNPNPKTCVEVYQDGARFYERDPKSGKVTSLNHLL